MIGGVAIMNSIEADYIFNLFVIADLRVACILKTIQSRKYETIFHIFDLHFFSKYTVHQCQSDTEMLKISSVSVELMIAHITFIVLLSVVCRKYK